MKRTNHLTLVVVLDLICLSRLILPESILLVLFSIFAVTGNLRTKHYTNGI